MLKWYLIEGLRNLGHAVHYVCLDEKILRPAQQEMYARLSEYVSKIGAVLTYRENLSDKDETEIYKNMIQEFAPDFLLCYNVRPVELLEGYKTEIKRVIISIDLDHLPSFYRVSEELLHGSLKVKWSALKQLVPVLLGAYHYRRDLISHFKKADLLINHAANHADWLREHTGRRTLYVPNPVGGRSVIGDPIFRWAPVSPPRFLLVGNFNGIATLSGFYFFVQKVMPYLCEVLDAGKLEIHILGKGGIEPRIKKVLDRKGIFWPGFIEDPLPEYEKACAMVVPTPIKLGFRTRILDAFRYGLPVIAHSANALGFPEMKHRINCLMTDNGQEMAIQMIELAENEKLRNEIYKNSLNEFNSNVSADHTCRKIVEFLKT